MDVRGRERDRQGSKRRQDNVSPDMWKDLSDASKRKEKQKWAIEKPKLDNARRETWYFLWTDTPAARHIFTCTVTPQITQHR